MAALTALLAFVLVVGSTELALSLSERARLADLRAESVDLANALASYLSRISPIGDPGALRTGLNGWSRRHLTNTTAIAYLRHGSDLEAVAASDSQVQRCPDSLDYRAGTARTTLWHVRRGPPAAWEVAAPLGPPEHPYGVLDVEVSAGRLELWSQVERRRGYAFAIGSALLLSLGVALLTSRWVGRPLGTLTLAMAGAHGGAEAGPTAPEVGPPEFQGLAQGYNALRQALARRERESAARAGLLALAERARGLDRLAQAEEIAQAFAHEIGTPLNTMSGHLQLLREDLRRAGDHHGEERATLMLGQIDRVAKIVRGGVRGGGTWPAPLAVPTDLDRLVADLLRFLEPSLAAVEVTVSLETGQSTLPLTVRTDPDFVEQILLNLVKNAIEALAPGGRIALLVEQQTEQAVVEVSDDGPGLSEKARSHLFQPFVTSKGSSGTGLGLAVSRRLARALGGELVYLPSLRGTRWRLTLPTRPTP